MKTLHSVILVGLTLFNDSAAGNSGSDPFSARLKSSILISVSSFLKITLSRL